MNNASISPWRKQRLKTRAEAVHLERHERRSFAEKMPAGGDASEMYLFNGLLTSWICSCSFCVSQTGPRTHGQVEKWPDRDSSPR